jgi:hypothetical protein
MPEGLTLALALPGLWALVATSLLAGLVYGFAGFGSALIFMPLAVIFLPPAMAIGAFSMSALASFATVVPGAWKVCERRAVLGMIAAAVVATPVGVWLLRVAEAGTIKLAVSVIVLGTLAVLIAGWRFRLRPGWGMRLAIGALSGILGGSTGLNGPPVILFNLGADQPVAVTRGNLAVFLTVSSLSFLPQLWAQGMLPPLALWLGAILFLPYAIGTSLGGLIFRPDRVGIYRPIAYVIIGGAGLAGLPIWS